MDASRRDQVRSTTHTIGERIRLARARQHVSQEALAATLGVSFQQVQKYESGSNRVSACTLLAIAEALDTEITFFLPSPVSPISRAELADAQAHTRQALATLDRALADLAAQREQLTEALQRFDPVEIEERRAA